jgi:hypothetical protein
VTSLTKSFGYWDTPIFFCNLFKKEVKYECFHYEFNQEKADDFDRILCHTNAGTRRITAKRADKCDEVNHPLCSDCPFIVK